MNTNKKATHTSQVWGPPLPCRGGSCCGAGPSVAAGAPSRSSTCRRSHRTSGWRPPDTLHTAPRPRRARPPLRCRPRVPGKETRQRNRLASFGHDTKKLRFISKVVIFKQLYLRTSSGLNVSLQYFLYMQSMFLIK